MQKSQPSPNGDMSLESHLNLLGLTANDVYRHTSLERSVVDRALKGEPIIEQHAQQICKFLNGAYGIHGYQSTGFQPKDIIDLKIWQIPDKHIKPALQS